MMSKEEFEELINKLTYNNFFFLYSVPPNHIEFVKQNALRFYQGIVLGCDKWYFSDEAKIDMSPIDRAKVCADLIRLAGVKCGIKKGCACEQLYLVYVIKEGGTTLL